MEHIVYLGSKSREIDNHLQGKKSMIIRGAVFLFSGFTEVVLPMRMTGLPVGKIEEYILSDRGIISA